MNSRHAPELDLPARFMALAMVMLGVVAAISPWAYPLLLQGFYAPKLLTFVHLNTLGVIAAVLIGAGYQLVPVVLQTPLSSVRLGRISFWCYIVGIACFLPGIMRTWHVVLATGASLVFTALVLYIVIIARTLRRARRHDVVSAHIAVALVGLAGGIISGLLLAGSKGNDLLGGMTLRFLSAHAALMLAGWVMIMLNGVAYRLVGMFTLSEDKLWRPGAWAELFFSAAGAWTLALGLLSSAPRELIATGATAIVIGQALFGYQLTRLYRGRRRRGFDIHIPFALVAAGSGLLAALLLAGALWGGRTLASNVWVAVGWLAIAGVALTAIQGFFYKISTFLVWLRRYAPVAGRSQVPKLEELYNRRLGQTGWTLWLAALAGSLGAILIPNQTLATVAGATALAGLGCFLANVAQIAAHVRSTAPLPPRTAGRAKASGIGKEEPVS